MRGKFYRVTFDENEDDEDDPEKTETSDPVSFNLDNFQPFLKEVNIHLNGIQVYHLAWVRDDCGGIKYTGGALQNNLSTLSEEDFNHNLDIEVFTSESMRFLDLNIEAFGKLVAEDDLILLNHSTDRTYFSWRVNSLAEYQSTANSGFALQNLLAFSFWGEDYPVTAEAESGNKLLQLGAFFDPMNAEPNNEQTCVTLPHRVAVGTGSDWSDNGNVTIQSGDDNGHYLVFPCNQKSGSGLQCCPEIEIDHFAIVTQPSSCGGSDGHILEKQVNASGGEWPYTWQWYDPLGSPITNTSNLSPGSYCLEATDANGCVGTICYDMVADDMSEVRFSEVTPACLNTASGAIFLITTVANDPAPNLRYTWSHGVVTEGDDVTRIDDLAPGSYSVTITNLNAPACAIEARFTVGTVNTDLGSPLAVAADLSADCGDSQANGKIDLRVTGGVSPYRYDWADGADADDYRGGLNNGTYCVSVTDRCGQTTTGCFDLLPLAVTAAGVGGCESGQLSAEVSGGTPPFSFVWNDGTTQSTFSPIENGAYTVTVTDGNGCGVVSDPVVIENTGFSIDAVTGSCGNLLTGEIAVSVHNPDDAFVSILLDGNDFFTNQNNSGDFAFSIEDLEGGLSHTLRISVGGCVVEREIFVPNDELIQQFSHLDGATCVFDQVCQGEVIDGATIFETMELIIDEDNTGGIPLFQSCSAGAICNGERVETLQYGTTTLPVEAYRILVITLANAGKITQDRARQLIDPIRGPGNECDMIRFCPLTLTNWGDTWLFENGGDISFENNCLQVNCSLFSGVADYDVCQKLQPFLQFWGVEITEDGIPGQVPVQASCELNELPVRQLVLWHEAMETTYPDDYNAMSTLHEFIEAVIADEELRAASGCATVRFCSNTFEFIDSDIELVDCTIVIPIFDPDGGVAISPNCWTRPPSAGIETWKCIINGNLRFLELPTQFDPSIFTNSLTAPDTDVAMLAAQLDDIYFEGMSTLRLGQRISTKAFVVDDSGNSYYVAFNPNYLGSTSFPAGELEAYDGDYNQNIVTAILRGADPEREKQVIIEFQDSLRIEHTVFATNKLLALNQSTRTDGIILNGRASGSLSIDGQTLIAAPSDRETYFALHPASNGALELAHSFYIADKNDLSLTTAARDQTLIGEATGNTTLRFASGKQVSVSAGKLVSVDLLAEEVRQVQVEKLDPANFSVHAAGDHPSGATYVLCGLTQDQAEGGTNSESFVLLKAADTGGAAAWVQRFDVGSGTISDHLIEPVGMDHILVAFTFTGQVDIGGVALNSQGGKDIALVLFDSAGNYLGHLAYGSPDDEEVKQVVYDNGYLHFGGNYAGATVERTIGALRYRQLENLLYPDQIVYTTFTRPFLTWVKVEDLLLPPAMQLANTADFREANTNRYQVVPNPSSGRFRLLASSDLADGYTYRVDLFDLTGKKIASHIGVSAQQLRAGLSLDLRESPKGLYYFTVTGSGRSTTGKIIVQ